MQFQSGFVSLSGRGGLIKLDAAANATLRIHTATRQACDVATALAALEHCAFAGLVLGRFDVLAYLIAPTRQEIAHLIDTQITPLPGVLAMDVREPVGNTKHRYDLAVVSCNLTCRLNFGVEMAREWLGELVGRAQKPS